MKIKSRPRPEKGAKPHTNNDLGYYDLKDPDQTKQAYPDYDEFLNPNPYSGHDDEPTLLQCSDYMDRIHERR